MAWSGLERIAFAARGVVFAARRASIVAVAVTILGALMTPGAFAGLAIDDGAGKDGVAVSPMDMAKAYYDYLSKFAPGVVEPLIAYNAAKIVPAKCIAGAKPVTHAILIGASTAGGPFRDLVGPDNDVALLATSLKARGVEDANMTILTRRDAGRARLAEAFRGMLAQVACGDQVILHFGGNAARATDLVNTILPQKLRDQYSSIALADIWNDYPADQNHLPTQALRWTRKADLFLALNHQAGNVLDVISAADISDFVTNIRNLQADITVTLDTSYAAAADIAGRQEKAGDTNVWNLDTGANEAAVIAAYATATTLLPVHGSYAAFYSSTDDSPSIELEFNGTDGGSNTYGVFTFRLANVIQNRSIVTVRALAESLRAWPTTGREALQRYRIEASDPERVLFSDGTRQLPATDPIVITKPTPKRGAAAMERPEVEIAGTVNWSSPLVAVLVSGKKADSKPDGGFAYTAQLKVGLNSLDIVALTADGRTHEKTLELLFEGDKQALQGDGKRYAVIIANETYDRARSGFDALKTPFEDAIAIADILTTKYGFVTEAKLPDGGAVFPLFLKDATRRDIETVLYKIGLAAGEKDTVLIYYAGHGIYEAKTTIAFWVPSDAEAGVPISYLSASTISESIQRMQAGKVVVISDSCFSGALLRGGGDAVPAIAASERDRALLRLSQRRTRILISSGNNEPVEDAGGAGHSVFARALLNGLEDMQHESFSARELYSDYILPFVSANAEQEPQYRPIERSGHEGGDIVFVRQTP